MRHTIYDSKYLLIGTNDDLVFGPPSISYSNGVIEDKETGEQSVKGLTSLLQFNATSNEYGGIAQFTIDWGDGSLPTKVQYNFSENESKILSVEKIIYNAGSYTATITDASGSYEIAYTVQDAVYIEVSNINRSTGTVRNELILETLSGTTGTVYVGDGTIKEITESGTIEGPNIDTSYDTIIIGLLSPDIWTKIDFRGLGTCENINQTNATELTFLDVNNISEIDVTNNTKLVTLDLNDCNLTSLDVTQNTALETLKLGRSNSVDTLDLTNNTKLINIDLNTQPLTSIDVSNATNLQYLRTQRTNIGSIDITQNTELIDFDSERSSLSGTLDISNNTKLQTMDLRVCDIDTLAVNNTTDAYPDLTSILAQQNGLTSIDVTTMPALDLLYVNNNPLSTLDLSNNDLLTRLDINSTGIVFNSDITFNTSNYPDLIYLNVRSTDISTLDLTNFTEIESLFAPNNSLTWSGISLGSNSVINSIDLQANALTTIDTSSYGSLLTLTINANDITSLTDITLNTGIETIDISDNPITSETLDFTAYPSLINIYANDNGDDNDIDLTGVDLTEMSNLQTLEVQSNSVNSLTSLSDGTELQTLDLRDNSLSSISLNGLISLQTIYLQNNTIDTDVDLTGLSSLSNIYLQSNDLPSLTALNETNVSYIDISDNAITSSDEIDEQLEACVTVGNTGGTFDSSDGSNAEPGVDGEDAIDTLEGDDWNVTTN